MVDAAGAIYVIGGIGGSYPAYYFQDVWVSTDGGARDSACASALCARCEGTAGAGGINRSAGGAGRPRVRRCVQCDRL